MISGTPRSATIAAGILTLLAVLLPLWSGFDAPGGAMDEGMLLVYPELILQGRLPYRDFETFYGPGNLWMLAGAYSVFGVHIDVERSVGLLYRLALASGIFLLVRRWSLSAAIISTVLLVSLLIPTRLAAFAWLGGISFALWSLILLAGRSAPWRVAGAGMLAGVALLYRVDLGPAVLFSSAPLLFLLPSHLRWRYLAGAAVALLPLAVLALAAGPRATLENIFTYPVLIANHGRRLPLSEASDTVYFLFFLHVGACICNVLAAALACVRDRQSRTAHLFLGAALLGAGLTHQAMQRVDFVHVVVSVFLSLALLPIALVILFRRGAVEDMPFGWSFAASGAVFATVFFTAPGLPSLLLGATLHSLKSGAFAPPSVVAQDRRFPRLGLVAESQRVVDFLLTHAHPGERLFIGTGDLRYTFYNDTFFYHLLPSLIPATYFLEMNPLSANRPHSRLANDVASADWLVLNRSWDEPSEPNLSRRPGSDAPNEVVRTQFIQQFSVGPFDIYRRRAQRNGPEQSP